MKLYSVSIIIFVLIALSTIVNAQQAATDSCNSTLPLNDLTFNTSLLQCTEAWTPQNFILRVSQFS
jgi:hypothetical protein